jgi:arylformamidase
MVDARPHMFHRPAGFARHRRWVSEEPTERKRYYPWMNRRNALAACAAVVAATATANAQEPHRGASSHAKGPRVFLDYDQEELDAAYDQLVYEPNLPQVSKRFTSNSEVVRQRIGAPQRVAYGAAGIERLDIYRTRAADAPVFVFIHGGAWRSGRSSDYGFPAEMFLAAGVHYVVPDFSPVQDLSGNLNAMTDQVRRAVAWVVRNAASFGGDPKRVYVGGHSSGAHLAGVVLTTDWEALGGLPHPLRGGVCISGMYELHPVRLSSRSSYVRFDDATEAALSSQRHLDRLRAPLVVAYGTYETPEFQRQNSEFAAEVKAAGKPVELVVGQNYSHMEMCETLASPYGTVGYAALTLIRETA